MLVSGRKEMKQDHSLENVKGVIYLQVVTLKKFNF